MQIKYSKWEDMKEKSNEKNTQKSLLVMDHGRLPVTEQEE